MRERKAAADRTWVFTNDDVGNVTEIMEMADCPGDLVLTNHTVMAALVPPPPDPAGL